MHSGIKGGAESVERHTYDPLIEWVSRGYELAAEIVQLERQLRLLIEAGQGYLDAMADQWGSVERDARCRQLLEDRVASAKAHLS